MRDKTKLRFRSARFVRRAGALQLVMPRTVWKQVGIGVGDTVEIQYCDGCVVIALGKRSARIRKAKKLKCKHSSPRHRYNPAGPCYC